MVGEYMSSLWVVDEKTTTRLGPSWIKSFTMRGQLLGYCYAAREFGLPVNGFIVRGLSFLRDYYGHAEVVEVVPDFRLNQWREQIEIDAAQMVASWKAGHFSKAFGEACNAYGGCSYRRLCDKENWKEWWQQHYEVDYWDPMSKTQKIKEHKTTKDILEIKS